MYGQLAQSIATGLLLAMLAVAMVTDLRVGKVYNSLTAPCALAGLLLGLLSAGLAGLGSRLLAVVAVAAVVVVLARVAALGGGDVKLLMAVGALQGLHFIAWTMVLTGLLGGVLALVIMLRRRALKQTAYGLVTVMLSSGAGAPQDLASGSSAGKIPYSLAIAAGAMLALALGA